MQTTEQGLSVMRAAVLTGVGRIELVTDRPQPVLAPDEVLVRVTAVGVCGSDVHYYREGRIGHYEVEPPLILGHEPAGVIVATGDSAEVARVGQRVSIEPQRPCRKCPQCTAGRYNLCPSMKFLATPPIDGAFCEYVAVPAAFAHPVRDTVTDEMAALLEPLSVAIAAVRKAQVKPGDRTLIAGAGPVGVLTAQVAQVFGASEIFITDLSSDRRRVADAQTAAHAIPADDSGLLTLNVDAFIDCTGASAAVATGIQATKAAGQVVFVGLGAPTVEIPLQIVQDRELTLRGVFRYANTWPLAEQLAATREVDLAALVTGRYQLDDTVDALESTAKRAGLKAIVNPAA